MSDEIKLKKCPACEQKSQYTGENNSPLVGAVRCTNYLCNIIGPRNDPTGEKWNSMPRRIDDGRLLNDPTRYVSMSSFPPMKRGDDTSCVRCPNPAVICNQCAYDMYHTQISLRDQFAMAVLSLISLHAGTESYANEASEAYRLADALLAERNKKGGE